MVALARVLLLQGGGGGAGGIEKTQNMHATNKITCNNPDTAPCVEEWQHSITICFDLVQPLSQCAAERVLNQISVQTAEEDSHTR